jgi:glycosyltransferase involved in cell wall biosynthesis
MALAAHEMSELQSFYCSLYDAPECWGARFGDFVGTGYFEGRRADGLKLDKVVEFPWPLIWKAMRDRFYRRGVGNWLTVNSAFDLWVAKQLQSSPPSIFVGTATSDLYSLKVAKRNGSALVHDCPGIHPFFEARLLEEAADHAGMKILTHRSPGRMERRKLGEYDLTDVLMVYSGFHRKSFEDEGFAPEQIFESPLWVDPGLWYRDAVDYPGSAKPMKPLKLLFVGSISLRKGIPFLLDAVAQCGAAVELTIVGTPPLRAHPSLVAKTKNVTYLSPQSKTKLRNTYQMHDVLVLPSVCDSFGFVALEAMACGLPVIITENCGAPSPYSSWRVPAMDSRRLAERILYYADDRTRISKDGKTAMVFSSVYTPQQYRDNVRGLFSTILNNFSGLSLK